MLVIADIVLTDTFSSITGCDSIVITEVNIKPVSITAIDISTCGFYEIPRTGDSIWKSTIYTDTIVSSLACNSILVYDIEIFNTIRDTSVISACGSYKSRFNKLYTSSGFTLILL